MLRAISELQGSFQHRVTLIEQNFRELTKQQHGDFATALDHNTLDVQKRLWADLEQIQRDFEKMIHSELRVLRQKQPVAAAESASLPSATSSPETPIDWMRFGEVFRGCEERIHERQEHHARRFVGTVGEIIDLGCGRGEFLEAAREQGLEAHGIDQSAENIALCTAKGLVAERADLFGYLAAQPDRSLAGVYCSQVVEHLPPDRLPVLIGLLGAKLRPGALLAIETPNPECLAIFATHFYIDPTHTRPVPPVLLRFYLEEAGFGGVEVERLSPAVESLPALAELPEGVRSTLFGGLDYAIFGRKL
jgi:O-antigen chain-terminating methyltransferase